MPHEDNTVADPRRQQVIEKVLKERVGVGFAFTEIVAEEKQPSESVPVTVNTEDALMLVVTKELVEVTGVHE